MYEFNFYKKDIHKPLLKTDYYGLSMFFEFFKEASPEQITCVSGVHIYPKHDVFYIDIESRNVKRVLELSGRALDLFMEFYERADKENVLNMSVKIVG